MTAQEQIDKLDSPHRFTLYMVAYNNCWLSSQTQKDFCREFRLTQREFNTCLSDLNRQGLVQYERWISDSYSVRPQYRVAVLRHLMAHPDIEVRILKTASPSRDGLADAISYGMSGSRPAIERSIDEQQARTLFGYIEEPWARKALSLLPDDKFYDAVDHLVFNATNEGTLLSPEAMQELCIDSARPGENGDLLYDLHEYYMYVAYGQTRPRQKRPVTYWALTLGAIRAACRGEFDEALKAFTMTLKLVNKTQYLKNAFIDLIPQYVYIMTLGRKGTPETTKKLGTIINKSSDDNLSMVFGRQLAIAFTSTLHLPEKLVVASLYKYTALGGKHQHGLAALAYLLDRYYELGCRSDSLPPFTPPTYAFLRHELRDYIELDPDEKKRLEEVFGPEPLLSGIRRKQKWEWALEDILNSVQNSAGLSTSGQAAPKNRIIYLEQPRDVIEPKYQNVLKSGRWSSPRNVSKQRFCDGQADHMDDTDLAIAGLVKSQLSRYSYYYTIPDEAFKASLIIPRLVGTDKLFRYGSSGKLEPVKVEERKLYITLKKDRMGYKVESPVTAKDLRDSKGSRVCAKDSDGSYSVYSISETEQKILSRLLDIGRFPASAEQVLQQFLAQISDHIDVRSPLLDKSSVQEVEGSAVICLKVESTSSSPYPISICALPLEKGAVRCIPGTGKAVYYDNVDGSMVRVRRNLKGELANYQAVMEQICDDESPFAEGDYNVALEVDRLLDLLEYVKQNPELAVLEWPQGKEIRLKDPLAKGVWTVGLKSNHGWFDVEGEVRVDDNTVLNMSQLLQLVSESKGRYIRLGDNDFVAIDRKLRRQLERLEAVAVRTRGKVQISQYGAAALDESVLDGEVKIQQDKALTRLKKRIADSADLEVRKPRGLKATLRPYQLEGFQWMMRLASWGAGACLADDMGLGKTVQTLAFLLAKAKEGPALITAPASVVPNWQSELERFAPSLNVTILNKADDRAATIAGAGAGDVVLSTYGLLNTEVEQLSKKEWATVCLDEAHTIKNRETKMSQAAMELQAKYRIILTGTPIQNHLGELWNLFRFINPGLLGSYDAFRQKFVVPIHEGDKERQRALQRMLKPFMLRRTKDEVIDDLPDKTDIIIPVELTSDEAAMYEAMRQKAVADLEQATKLDVNTLSELTRLRRAACAISLTDPAWHGADSKVQRFIDLVADFKGDGENRMLVFSQFTSFLEIVRRALDQAGEKYLYLDGSTTMKQREQLVQEFREGSCPLFLISLKAGGLGLNLPEANYVVHLDPWWNPAIEQQATDRAYRIGQKRNVTVYHLISKNTIEEKILRLHRTKRDLADSLLEGADMAGKLTVADILDLMTPEESDKK